MIGDSLRGSEIHLVWENIGAFVDMSAEKASEQIIIIILTPGNNYQTLGVPGRSI